MISRTTVATPTLTPPPKIVQPKTQFLDHSKPTLLAQLTIISAMVIPFIGLIAAIVLMWGWGVGWVEFGLLAGMYVATAFGITVGFHRLFTHNSFETNGFVRFTLAVLGSMAVEGPLIRWVAVHRQHHQHSDQPDDPHSPHHSGTGVWGVIKGFFHAHMSWTLKANNANLDRYVKDLMQSRSMRVVSGLFPIWVAIGLLIPAILGGLLTMSWMGALLGFLWGGLVRVFFVHHVTWSVNSFCHIWGSRPYPEKDLSTNNFVFGVLAMGEGWHNNHHAFPTSARHGLRWWQIDTSYMLIKMLSWFGMAWNIKVPTAKQLAT